MKFNLQILRETSVDCSILTFLELDFSSFFKELLSTISSDRQLFILPDTRHMKTAAIFLDGRLARGTQLPVHGIFLHPLLQNFSFYHLKKICFFSCYNS